MPKAYRTGMMDVLHLCRENGVEMKVLDKYDISDMDLKALILIDKIDLPPPVGGVLAKTAHSLVPHLQGGGTKCRGVVSMSNFTDKTEQ